MRCEVGDGQDPRDGLDSLDVAALYREAERAAERLAKTNKGVMSREDREDIVSDAWLRIFRSSLYQKHIRRRKALLSDVRIIVRCGANTVAFLPCEVDRFTSWSWGHLVRRYTTYAYWDWRRKRLRELDALQAHGMDWMRRLHRMPVDPSCEVIAKIERERIERLADAPSFAPGDASLYHMLFLEDLSYRETRSRSHCRMDRICNVRKTAQAAARKQNLERPSDLLTSAEDSALRAYFRSELIIPRAS